MNWTRRDFIKTGVAASGALALGCTPTADVVTDEIIRKVIPSSGRAIPVIGIGTRNYRVGDDPTEMDPLRATLRAFIELGGEVLDTAPSYGNSESVLGALMSELGVRDRVFLATKVDRDDSAESLERLGSSMAALQTDSAELIQVHNLRGVESNLGILREWKQQGRIGHVGITTSSARQYERFEEVLSAEALDFIQINYSLGDRTAAESILPMAADNGVATLINLPFGRGRLFRRVGERPLPDWASDFGATTWAQFFLKYVVSHPAVTAAIPGTTKDYHAVDNFGASMGDIPDAAMRSRMEAFYDAIPEPEG